MPPIYSHSEAVAVELYHGASATKGSSLRDADKDWPVKSNFAPFVAIPSLSTRGTYQMLDNSSAIEPYYAISSVGSIDPQDLELRSNITLTKLDPGVRYDGWRLRWGGQLQFGLPHFLGGLVLLELEVSVMADFRFDDGSSRVTNKNSSPLRFDLDVSQAFRNVLKHVASVVLEDTVPNQLVAKTRVLVFGIIDSSFPKNLGILSFEVDLWCDAYFDNVPTAIGYVNFSWPVVSALIIGMGSLAQIPVPSPRLDLSLLFGEEWASYLNSES